MFSVKNRQNPFYSVFNSSLKYHVEIFKAPIAVWSPSILNLSPVGTFKKTKFGCASR